MPPILLQKFWRNRNGNFIAVFALLLAPLLLAVEFSVDYASAVRVENELQALVDAMALASLKELPDEKAAMLAAQNAYASGLAGIASGVISSKMSMAFADEPNMSSKASISGQIGGMSGFVFDIALDFEVHAKAEIPPALLEIAVTADLSDSMNDGGRIAALRASLDEFITTVFAAENPSLAVRLAIVPFSGSVNLPSYAKAWAKSGESEGHGEHGGEGATAGVADANQESLPAGAAPACATTRGGVLDMTVMTPKEKLFDSKPLNGLSCPTGFTMMPLMDGASRGNPWRGPFRQWAAAPPTILPPHGPIVRSARNGRTHGKPGFPQVNAPRRSSS